MRMEIFKLLNEKNIEFNKLLLPNSVTTINIREKYLSYFIFEESDLQEFIKIFKSYKQIDKFNKIILIIHKIELKHFCEKLIKKEVKREKIELYLYDWAELGRFTRNLM